MSWEDNIVEAVYESPSGISFVFQFEGVEKEIVKKTTAFDFPDVEGTYIQDLGKKGRRYPMRVIFWGEEYDTVAESFDNAIEEKGPGILQHPLYGTFDVVPFGSIKRRDDLVTAANQAIYDITFYETIKIIFPVSELAAENSMVNGSNAFSSSAAEGYEDGLSIDTAPETTGYIDSAKAGLRKIKRAMAQEFNDLANLAEETIDTLVGGPLLIATQLIELTRLPGRTAASIQAKLEAYGNLLESLTSGPNNQFEQGLDSQAGNAFLNNNLIASTAVLGSIESTITTDDPDAVIFTTRTEAIEAIENLDEKLTAFIEWSDTNRESLVLDALPTREPGTTDLIDTGEAYQDLLEVFSISQGRLTQIAFSALQERSVILDRGRTFIDFAAEFYQQLDEQYDFIIQSNNLTGWEIVNEIPKGREMVYYV
jgi:prophage DNA circulation protein